MKSSKPRLTVMQSIDNELFAKQIRLLQAQLKNYRVNSEKWLSCNSLITCIITKHMDKEAN